MSGATIHATTVAIRGHGVLLTGVSGAGKSDLALRLIDRGAELVADDYTDLTVVDGRLVARAPATIAGKMEVRGLGILERPFRSHATVLLAVRLAAEERMPCDDVVRIAGVDVAQVTIAPFPASAPLKVELALERLIR
ncbi:aldolase [Sphingomonas sp. Leaf412]|uniref:HPr kinase/phosphorylase n=1 Tax=Sphingomonas sp. Leaf412 TaxID=1736370 RepID=UPI0006F71FE9|nr:HPr kinase/phosphatase C-terminal domain-containing protein [Sphingomonas sp. Leaf412]KQT32621.1 aldolase [Sphingomonas sp. Leaf412]